MSNKATCPVCTSHTSAIYAVLEDGEGDTCPVCGVSVEIMREINAIREARGTEEMRGKLTDALTRLARAEADRDLWKRRYESMVIACTQVIETTGEYKHSRRWDE